MSLILLGILNSQVTAGGAGAYDLLETQVLSSSAASVTFTGLGSYTDYKHLQIRAAIRATRTDVNGSAIRARFDSDTGTNYAIHELRGNGSAVSSGAAASASYTQIGYSTSGISAANHYAGFVIDILDFYNSSKYTTIRSLGGASEGFGIALTSGLWMNTTIPSSFQLYASLGNIDAGSRFSLYGIR